MKKLKLIAGMAFLSITLFSCSSDDDNSNNDLTCEDASSATLAAAQAFNDATDANYSDRCNDYKEALQDQIDACGDDSGILQAIIDDLGDCTLTPANAGVISVVVGTLTKTFETNITITTSGATRHIRANDNATSDYIEFDLQPGVTGANKIMNFNIHLISSDYNPFPPEDGLPWASNITVNSATNIDGTFFGYVTSPTTGADLELTQGVINLDL